MKMKVRLPQMVQDPLTARYKEMRTVEEFFAEEEDFFLDGPVAKRVAVLDFDPESGELVRGARFQPPSARRKLGRYKVSRVDGDWDIYALDFIQASVFATVLRTMYMFEEPDTLGRKLVWAFDAPQLLLVPRAGEWANAFYERASHSLQLFYFTVDGGQVVYTALSRDIVAHETGHAILDGIAPDLYNAITPQSLALHEAVADLSALMMALRSGELRRKVLSKTGGSIKNSTAFSSVAEEFGRALDREGHGGYLRSLLNERTLDPNDTSVDPFGTPNHVTRDEPHALSEVLTGALYKIFVKMHETYKKRYAQEDGTTEFSASGKALAVAAKHFQRMVFRALDYLPPGEVSFADYARAIIAADQALYPKEDQERNWIRDEFVHRHMAPGPESLEVRTNFRRKVIRELDLDTLLESDWAAYEFANRNRRLLGIPQRIPFRVRPRLDVSKTYYTKDGEQRCRECIFKVSWDHQESNELGARFPRHRQITVGTTLAIDWDTRRIKALLTSDLAEQQRTDRDLLLHRLLDEGLLRLEHEAVGPSGAELGTAVIAEATQNLMRVRGAARTLHIVGEV
jgi:hypothetical protein